MSSSFNQGDQSTEWSEYQKYADGNWWKSRRGPTGQVEYHQYDPLQQQIPQQQYQNPRSSSGQTVVTGPYATSTDPWSNVSYTNSALDYPNTSNYTLEPNASSSTSSNVYAQYGNRSTPTSQYSVTNAPSLGYPVTNPYPQPVVTSSYSTKNVYSQPASTNQYQTTNSPQETSQLYPASQSVALNSSLTRSSSYPSNIPQNMGSTSAPNYASNTQPYPSSASVPQYATGELRETGSSMTRLTSMSSTMSPSDLVQGIGALTMQPGVPTRVIRAASTTPTEELDPRYQVVADRDQKSFWKFGRVFMMLWTEPAQVPKVPREGGTRNGSHISTVWLGEPAYSEIRRFVVVGEGHGNSICSPIQTYSGQATLKPNLPDAGEHAIIYTGSKIPNEHSYVAIDGTTVYERLEKRPVRVKSEQPDKEGQLDPKSRLNYGKIYTVEHYVRVLKIGIVHPESLATLRENSPYKRTTPVEKGTTKPPPQRSSGSGSTSKGNSSHGRGHSSGDPKKKRPGSQQQSRKSFSDQNAILEPIPRAQLHQ